MSIFSLILISIAEVALASFLFSIIFFLIGLIFLKISIKQNFKIAKNLFTIIYFLNILLSNAIIGERLLKTGKPYYGSDDKTYEVKSLRLTEFSYVKNINRLEYRSGGYSHGSKYYTAFMGSFINGMKLIGLNYHYLIFCYFNAMLVALTGAVAFYFAKVTGLKEGTSQLAALMIGMWPSYVFNSAMVRRDTLFIFFLFLSAYLVTSIFSRKKNTTIGEIFLLVFSIVIVSHLRVFYGLLLFFIFLLVIIQVYKKIVRPDNLIVRYLSILLFAISSLFLIQTILPTLVIYFDKLTWYYELYSSHRSNILLGGGILSSIFSYPPIISIPLRFLFSFVSPPPVPNFNMIFENLNWFGTIVWFFLSPYLLWAIYDIYKGKRQIQLEHKIIAIFFIVTFFSGIAIAFSEVHSLAGRLIGVLLIFYGIENWSVRLKSVFSFISLFGIYLTCSYLVVKIFL